MSDHDRLLQIANDAVSLALPIFGSRPATPAVTSKGDRDYVTTSDFEIERAMRSELATATPQIGFLGEEEGQTGTADRTWCLDPIDGTVNYVHGNPLCGISLALIEHTQPTVAVIAFPWLGTRYQARKAGGAWRDGQQIHVSDESELPQAVVAIGDYAVGEGTDELSKWQTDLTATLAAQALRIRMLGSAAADLAWLADGKVDASVTLANEPWDVAAGVLIAREAGAEVIGLDGHPHTATSTGTIAGSPRLGAQLLDLAKQQGAVTRGL